MIVSVLIVLQILFSFFLSESVMVNDDVVNVVLQDDAFLPRNVNIQTGTTIVFENKGVEEHWPASNIHPTHEIYSEFDPKKGLKPGESWQFTFNKPGTWRFHDHLNATISGVISVRDGEIKNVGELQIDPKKIFQKLGSNLWLVSLRTYFYFFPSDRDFYLSKQNVNGVIAKNNLLKLERLIELYGSRRLMEKLFAESDNAKNFNCHTAAHVVGRMSFEVLGDTAIHENTTLCHSGYQHGVIAAFVKHYGEKEVLSKVDEVCMQPVTSFGRLTCYHAAGHGLMAYLDNDLPSALKKCGEFSTEFKRSNCYVGVYMENIGSLKGDSLSGHSTVWLNNNDLHFPCNKIDQNNVIQRTCYAIQPEWMISLLQGDRDKLIEACKGAKEEFISSCFFGIGQNLAAGSVDSVDGIIKFCGKVPEDYRNKCLEGVQAVFMDFWGEKIAEQGGDFCTLMPVSYKDRCANWLKRRIEDISKSSV